jgi:pyrroloquinoline quinone (PQQ) biosynthesis protein C
MATALPPNEFCEAMEARIRGRTHSSYPIVPTIHEGRASIEQIAYLSVLFYHFTKETPQAISTIHTRCPDPVVRRRIMDTLIDEDTELRCGSESHPQLALQFATRFAGMTESEVINHSVPQCIRDTSAFRYRVAREMHYIIALGNSGIASESHAPEVVRLISEGLREHYGVADEDQESWIVHIEGDEEHGATGFRTVLEFAKTPELQQDMFWGIDNYLTHWGNFWRECEKGAVNRAQPRARPCRAHGQGEGADARLSAIAARA